MHQDFRNTFNEQFSNDKYQSFLESIHQDFPGVLDFRIAETPIFLTDSFVEKCTAAGEEIIDFIVRSDFKKQTEKYVRLYGSGIIVFKLGCNEKLVFDNMICIGYDQFLLITT